MLKSLKLPKVFPNRKILSIDIGGTLAKTAFYIPSSHKKRLQEDGRYESMIADSLPSKLDLRICTFFKINFSLINF